MADLEAPKAKSDGRWVKGQTGNPGGRPAPAQEIRKKAQEVSKEALATIVQIMRDETVMPGVRVSAAEKVLKLAGCYMTEDKSATGQDNKPISATTEQLLQVLNTGKVR